MNECISDDLPRATRIPGFGMLPVAHNPPSTKGNRSLWMIRVFSQDIATTNDG